MRPDASRPRRWPPLAGAAGVKDVAAFRKCLDDDSTAAAVAEDTLVAAKLGVSGTPTFILDGRMIEGYPGKRQMDVYVDRALSGANR